MLRLTASTLIAVAALSPRAQGQGRALAIEDYYRLATIVSPVISPDGRWVAFVVQRRDEPTGGEPGAAWVVPTGGQPEARQVSRAGDDVQSVSWTTDGRIRYLARGGAWIVGIDGTGSPEAEPAGPRRFPAPGGAGFVTLREVPPTAAPKEAESDFARRHEERFRGYRVDWLEFQRDGVAVPAPNPEAAPPVELHLTRPGAPDRRLTDLGLVAREASWSPTGDFLVFVADSSFRTPRRYGRDDLYRVTVDGAVRRLTVDDGLDNRAPAVSPDGRWVAVVRSYGTDLVIREKLDHGGPTDLALVPAAGGEIRNLTADWDLQAGDPTWTADGRHLLFVATIGGERHLFRVPAAGGPVEQVTRGPRRLNAVTFDAGARTMAYLVGRRDAPADLYVAATDGSGERRLTRINEDVLAGVALSPSERVAFRSGDGTPVEGWVTLPHGYRPGGGRYPLIVSSHGGPHAASGHDFDFKTQYFAANGYLVLETNFRSSTGYGEKFLWGTWGAWGTKDGEDVMAGVDHVVARYPVDRSRIGATGHSYGGFMTNWLITRYPDRFAAAVSGAGISNWLSDYGTADVARTKETEFFGTPWDDDARARMLRQSPLIYANRVRAPTLFVHGELDQRVPYEEAEQMYVALQKNGVPAKMIVYQGQYHGIRGPWNVVHRMLNERAWWDRWLKRAPSP